MAKRDDDLGIKKMVFDREERTVVLEFYNYDDWDNFREFITKELG